MRARLLLIKSENRAMLCIADQDGIVLRDGYPLKSSRVHGSRTVTVKVLPRGPIWRRHVEQLRPRHASTEDEDPGELSVANSNATSTRVKGPEASSPDEYLFKRFPTEIYRLNTFTI